MIRILIQRFEGKGVHEGYMGSYQFTVQESVEEDWAMYVLLKLLRGKLYLTESKHKRGISGKT